MADIFRIQGRGVPDTMITQYKDMGDTSHALVVSAQADVRVSDADVSASNPLPVTITNTPLPVIETDTVILTHTSVRLSANGLLIVANADRKYLLIENDSAVVYYINIGNNAGINEGIRLNANGGNFVMGAHFDNLDTRAVFGIPVSGANQNILITEGI